MAVEAQTKASTPFLGETLQEFSKRSGEVLPKVQTQDLQPFVGETSEAFESRRKGEAPAAEQRLVTVSADANGEFFVDCALNGQLIRMVVDTGATVVSLSREDAALAGIHVAEEDFTRSVRTANGIVKAAPVQIHEIAVGKISVRDIDALVLPPGNEAYGLLGISFLKHLKGFEMAGGRLTLRD